MSGPRILVVDDERGIRRTLRAYLTQHGYAVTAVGSGEEAIESMEALRPDLVLLDLVMPGLGGLETCKQLRARWTLPIIVLSVIDAEPDKVAALQAGADDYVTKPFGPDELVARIGVALRHRAGVASGEMPVFRCGDLAIDLGRRQVTIADGEVHLTPIEYDLLRCLATRTGRIVTRAMLLREVWGAGHEDEIQLLRFGVFQLRKKLNDDPLRPRYIFTEPGVGYRLGPRA
ncbi:MAG TPA: response regulator transcription factor [Isosphaeraceae bacterium]|nr:response regulator transcription factor [Isosphaeraceae bacterium]